MESTGNMQKGATRPVTGPPLWRSPEASDLQDPLAEVGGGSFVEHRARTEAAVPATQGHSRSSRSAPIECPYATSY